MAKRPSWLSSREAAALLDVKLATLYAYTSRGLVESVPGPNARGRRYARSSIERLKARHDARAGHAAVAAGALRFGEPTLETRISDIRADGPWYRGHSALELCERDAGFEAVFDLLVSSESTPSASWPDPSPELDDLLLPTSAHAAAPSSLLAAWISLAGLTDDTRHGASDLEEQARARRLTLWLAGKLDAFRSQRGRRGAGRCQPRVTDARGARASSASPSLRRSKQQVATQVLHALGGKVDQTGITLIDRTLVLCADHELNASTFAARVAASTGADLYACLGAALHTLSGGRHGGASARVEALLREIGKPERVATALRERLARGEAIPGFGQPLYPQGDPRGRLLFELAARAVSGARRPASYECLIALASAMQRAGHPGPNLDAGLVAVCSALRLPRGSAAALFAIGRIPGWVAHTLEQRAQRYILRPRARYVPASAAR